jgi:DNA-binding transcriptional regulator YiaG
MNANELRRLGVTGRHMKALRSIHECCTAMMTKPELDEKKFGQSLRTLREDAGISLREMARLLDLSAGYLSDCELGHRHLGLSHAVLFLKHCGV